MWPDRWRMRDSRSIRGGGADARSSHAPYPRLRMDSGARTDELAARVMGPEGLAALVETLLDRGYRVVGPTVRDGAIVLDELVSADELPHGWTASHDAASYRLERRDDGAVFGWAVGPHS